MDNVLIVGCGDIGCRVASQFGESGIPVTGVVKSEASARRVAAVGATACKLDLDRPLRDSGLALRGSLVFYFAPPPSQGVTDPRLERFLAFAAAQGFPARVVYISTSGVYGDCGGEWVDETRPPAPRTDRAKRRAAAEQALLRWEERTGAETIILRVPGIYGPGRLPIERLSRAVPVIRPEEAGFSNRIHAHDLAVAAIAAGARGVGGRVYNIADGCPTTMCDYFDRLADVLCLPRPPRVTREQAAAHLSPAMLSFADESRRLLVSRMINELGVSLTYPDLASGIAASCNNAG